MRFLAFFTIALGAVFLKLTLFAHLEIAGERPELPLAAAIFFALNSSPKEAACAGWAVGLMQDVFAGGAVGVSSLSYMIIAFFASSFRAEIYTGHFVTQMGAAFAATFFASAAAIVRLEFLSGSFEFHGALERAVYASAYTALLAPIIFEVLGPLKPALGLGTRKDFIVAR
jgi:rod shape-determining protein MreD